MCEELGDRASAAAACGKLGLCHHQKEHARAIELYEQHRRCARSWEMTTG